MSEANTVTFTKPAGPAGDYWEYMVFNEEHTLYFMLGGFGGSKSDALVTSAILDCINYPGAVICICRSDYAVLKRTTLDDFVKKCELVNIALGRDAVVLNKNEAVVTFPEVNGKQSKVYFFGLVSGDYERKLKSLQPFRIYIDEANEVTEKMLDLAILRCRAKVEHKDKKTLGRVLVKLYANDMGNNWLWRRFVGKQHPGKMMTRQWVDDNVGVRTIKIPKPKLARKGSMIEIMKSGVRGVIQSVFLKKNPDDDKAEVYFRVENGAEVRYDESYLLLKTACVYVFTEDNWSLNQQNIENFYLVSEDLRNQYLLGQIDTKTGLMFPMFDEKVHIIRNTGIDPSWQRVIAIDYGLLDPTAAVYAVLTPSGDVVIYDEYEQANLSVSENAFNIRAKLDSRRVRFVGDPKMWAREATMPSTTIASIFMEAGCSPMNRADNRRELGWETVREYLTPYSHHYMQQPLPRLYVTRNCVKTIERLMNFTWEESDKTTGNSHIPDALRYLIMAVYRGREYESEYQEVSGRNSEPNYSANWGRR